MKDWLNVLVPLATAVISSLLTYLFTSRSKRAESIIRFKEQKYAKLLVKLQGFVDPTPSPKLMQEFFEEQYQAWLYASDEVVKALNVMIRLIIDAQDSAPNPQAGGKAIGEIVLAMRRDLLHKTALDHNAFRYTNVPVDK